MARRITKTPQDVEFGRLILDAMITDEPDAAIIFAREMAKKTKTLRIPDAETLREIRYALQAERENILVHIGRLRDYTGNRRAGDAEMWRYDALNRAVFYLLGRFK